MGVEAIRHLRSNPTAIRHAEAFPQILEGWNASFNVITIMSNRLTPFHRDNGAASPWYDVLVALGQYSNGRIELPGIGQRFKYDPGTVVGLTGRILRHGVNCPGNRLCVAYHNKTTVIDSLGIPRASWMNTSHYTT